MGVLEKLGMAPESDTEYVSEFDTESEREFTDESVDEFDPNRDPEPGQPAPRTATRPKSKLSQVRDVGPRVTKKMRDDAQSEIESIVQVLALGWGWQAPPCGEALEEAAPAFAEKLTKIVARNPRWLQKVRDGGLIADIIACAGTLAPVAKTAAAYYTQPREGSSDGNGVEFDPTRFQPYDGTGFSRAG
jgi:hypothetical protein